MTRRDLNAVGGILSCTAPPLPAGTRKEFKEESVFVVKRIRNVRYLAIIVVTRETHGIVRAGEISLPAITDRNRAHVNITIAIHKEIGNDSFVGAPHDLQAHPGSIGITQSASRNFDIFVLEQREEQAKIVYQQVKVYIYIAATR